MNLRLSLNLLVARINSRYSPCVRSLLPIKHGFGLYNESRAKTYLNEPFDRFINSLRIDKKISGEITILQKNQARGRVVLKANTTEGKQVVIKWCNFKAPCTFNFKTSIDMERFMHGVVAPKLEGLIPEMVFDGEMFVGIEAIEGRPFSHYLYTSNDQNVTKILEKMLTGMGSLIDLTKGSEFNAKNLNRILIRDHDYMRQTNSGYSLGNLINISMQKINLEREYQNLVICAGEIFASRRTPWRNSTCLLDLDLQNILFDELTGDVWVVDTEDAYHGLFIFDLAWLSSRVYLSAKPLHYFKLCNSLFLDFIEKNDNDEPAVSISLYRTITALYLIIGIMNPSTRPEFGLNLGNESRQPSLFQRIQHRYYWYKDVNSVISEILHNRDVVSDG